MIILYGHKFNVSEINTYEDHEGTIVTVSNIHSVGIKQFDIRKMVMDVSTCNEYLETIAEIFKYAIAPFILENENDQNIKIIFMYADIKAFQLEGYARLENERVNLHLTHVEPLTKDNEYNNSINTKFKMILAKKH